MEHSKILLEYYGDLAKSYDENRFGNTYGQYIHQQEINTTCTIKILDLITHRNHQF